MWFLSSKYKNIIYVKVTFINLHTLNEGKQTILKLTHRGIHSFPDHPDFATESFAQGWNELIGTLLKNIVEEEVQI